MSTLHTLETLISLGAVYFFLRSFLHGLRRASTPRTSYRRAPSLLTHTEAQFYQTLRTAIGPQAVIQCKVRLADILLAPANDLPAFRKVSQKHVDFLLCERLTLRPLVAIELDDSSHARLDRQLRDRFVDAAYQSAELPLLHIPVQPRYDPATLLSQVQPFLLPLIQSVHNADCRKW